MIVYLLLAIVCLIIVYEFCANYEKFQSPSQIGLIGNSRDGVISLFWHRPHANYENIYQYLLYIKEVDKDVRLLHQKATDAVFYKKSLLNMNPDIEYHIQVVAVSSDGISQKSNTVILKAKNKDAPATPIPIPPLVRRITCNPDETYQISQSCHNPQYPNIDIDMTDHDALFAEMNRSNSHTFNL
jgi:hypothetical protein